MAVIKIDLNNFEGEILEYKGTALLDLYADWCGPCKMMAPIVDEIANERDDIKVCKVNVDECPQLAISYGVSSIPTLLVFKNGELAEKSVGFRPKDAILALVD